MCRNIRTLFNFGPPATDEEIRAAAEYFASVKRKPWIRVIEADIVPIARNAGVRDSPFMRFTGA